MPSKFLVPIVRSPGSPSIFFVPSAGTTVLSLVHLARALGKPFQAFELMELPAGQGPLTIERIAGICVAEIEAAGASGPCVVGGHCWGGVVAFEIAARLEAAGRPVAGLVLLEAVPPARSEGEAGAPADRTEVNKAVSDLCDQVRQKLSRLPPKLAERFGPMSWQLIDLALGRHVTSSLKAPLLQIRTPTHPQSVFQGWERLTSGGLEEFIVPGDAFSLLVAPAVETVAARLKEELAKVAG